MRAKRQNNQLELAFGKECKGEALSGLVEGTEVCVARAGTERPAVFISLNPSNRHVRTRMRGGVGGVESRDSPLSRFDIVFLHFLGIDCVNSYGYLQSFSFALRYSTMNLSRSFEAEERTKS